MSCQHYVDAKAFTGKGEILKSVSRLIADVDNIHQKMKALSELTRGIPARTFYLMVHSRTQTGQRSLRWRYASAKGKHISWTDLQVMITRLPTSLRDWYQKVNHQALSLNHEEKAMRSCLRSAMATNAGTNRRSEI